MSKENIRSRSKNPERYADLILNDPKRRLAHASSIISNPLWDAMFEKMKHNLFLDFCEYTSFKDRERIAMASDMLDDLKQQIEEFVKFGTPLKIVKPSGDSHGS